MIYSKMDMSFKGANPLTYGYLKFMYKDIIFEKGDDVEIKLDNQDVLDSAVSYGKILFFIKEENDYPKVVIQWYYTLNDVKNNFSVKAKKCIRKALLHEIFLSNHIQSVYLETINRKIVVVRIKNQCDYYCRYIIDLSDRRIKKYKSKQYAPYIIYSKIKTSQKCLVDY